MPAPRPNSLAALRRELRSAAAMSPDVTIGVIDGIPDLTHPLLQGAQLGLAKEFIPPGLNRPDVHGTQIASLIFGQSAPVDGLASGCSGLFIPIFFPEPGKTQTGASQMDLARAITFAAERGAAVINVSAGQRASSAQAEQHLEQALATCARRRVLVVAASGNDGCDCLHLPAAVQTVLAVGASDEDGAPSLSSNWGADYRSNGILAIGESLTVAVPGGGIGTGGGTSFAAAVISAIAACLLSLARREHYALDPLDIREILLESAARCELAGDGACDRYLAGSLDATAAIALVHRHGAASTATRLRESSDIQFHSGESASSEREGSVMSASDLIASVSNGPAPPAVDVAQLAGLSAGNGEDAAPKELVAQASGSTLAAAKEPLTFLPYRAPASDSLRQMACACGGSEAPQKVYALGALWYDFGTEARFDALVQRLGSPVQVNDPTELLTFLQNNLPFMAGLTFTLMQDLIPIYAIQPAGAFAPETYRALLDALQSAIDDEGSAQRVSIPGYISGATRLMNGMTVPVVYPDIRGMYKWRSEELLSAATTATGTGPAASNEDLLNFLNRVYYELRNLGITSEERAINYAATDAYQAQIVFGEAGAKGMALDAIRVVKSPICRPDSDCWDVELRMFDPENERRAGTVFRYTIDVSEVLPVTVGARRSWSARLGAA